MRTDFVWVVSHKIDGSLTRSLSRGRGFEWLVWSGFWFWIGFGGVLGCLRRSTDFHRCTRILFGGFLVVIGIG